jgi:capsular exopolysaccharide synthesis family protein
MKNVDKGENEIQSLAPYRDPSSPAPYFPNDEPDFDDEQRLGPRDYWRMIHHRLWLILTITFLGSAGAILYVARQPDIYQAEARIQVDLENSLAVGGSKSESVIIHNPGDDLSYFNTQLLLLRSPAFLRRVAKTLNFEQGQNAFVWGASRPETSWNLVGMVNNDRELEKSAGKPLRATAIAPASADGDMTDAKKLEAFVAVIKGGLEVKPTETSRLINITFSHSNPNSAARAANVVADTFVQANWEKRATSTSTASEFLQKRIAELQFKIGENEKRLIEYARDHRIFPLDSGRDIESDRLAALDRGLLDAESARKAAESEYQAALAPGAAASIVNSGNNAQLSSTESRLADLRHRRSVMLLETGENWPEVKELNQQIDDLEKQLKASREQAIGVVLTNLEMRYRQALAREQSLRRSFETQHSSAMSQNAAAIDYRMIQQENATYKSLLDSLLQRSKENDVILAATPNNVRVTDYATLPTTPVGPRRLRTIALAFLTFLGLGIGLAVLLGSLEDSVAVDSVERVEGVFGLPVLAVIPLISRRSKQLRGLLSRKRRNGPPVARFLLPENGESAGNGNGRPGLLLHEEVTSPLAESFRKLRTSVLHSNRNGLVGSILVTSSLPGEGKTTAAVNTGLVISQTGAKVLLVDGDLRHPSLHEILGMDNEKGLSTVLSNGMSEAEVLSTIEQYKESNLYVLPAGPSADNPAELFDSERFKRLLTILKSEFSHIIIDSPPISLFTDAVLAASVVDGVLMIVRGPKSPRQVGRYSLQSLDGVGAPILGIILNGVTLRSTDYSYYRHYYR